MTFTMIKSLDNLLYYLMENSSKGKLRDTEKGKNLERKRWKCIQECF